MNKEIQVKIIYTFFFIFFKRLLRQQKQGIIAFIRYIIVMHTKISLAICIPESGKSLNLPEKKLFFVNFFCSL
ncbi:MAG: hypothetical protein CSB01_00360 [Bacteroidia bacterium]|nr:MAG: hypothetical protein CSB01_00360 [Bacteroidia bacterium]